MKEDRKIVAGSEAKDSAAATHIKDTSGFGNKRKGEPGVRTTREGKPS